MENKKVTLSETIRLHIRAAQILKKYCPKLLTSMSLHHAVSGIIPYVTVFFSARIIEELAGLRRADVIWKWVIATVIVEGILALASHALDRWSSTKANAFFLRPRRVYTEKQLTMDYEEMESVETRDLLEMVLQNDNWASHGIRMLYNIVIDGVRSVVGVFSGIALTVGLFLTRVPAEAGAFTILDSPIVYIALLAALVIPTVISPILSAKGGRMTETPAMSANARFGNRLFSAFGFLSYDRERALDIRMYRQQKIARYHLGDQERFGIGFAPFKKLVKGKMGILYAIAACMPAILTGAVYVYVCLKAWTGAFGVGMVTQYVSAVTALTGSVAGVLEQFAKMRINVPYLEKTFEYLDIPNKMYQGSLTTEKRSDRQYDVEFRNVSFKYPSSDNYALKNVSVKFKVGSRLAVVGENGSGKTTFIKLLCRLYDPQEGEILLNGIDIRKYRYDDYMGVFSVVFQDFQLLSQPLGANVAGSMRYDREKVTKCLTDAGFAERLSELPDGLDTMLYRDFDDDGVTISGGEAQKIAIARALYKDAPFIILDEPTAALDPVAEAEIYRQFNDISGDKTAIYISHRLSSCRFCDEILVFDEGQIVEHGSHDGLLAEEGKYHELWHAQAQYYEGEQ